MSGAFDRVPGLRAYLAAQDMQEQRQMNELQQAAALQSLAAGMRKQQQEQAYRSAVQGLGPNPSLEQLAQVSAPYAGPEAMMRYGQASLDRKAALEAKSVESASREAMQREFQTARLEAAQKHADLTHQFNMLRAQTDADRLAETQRKNKVDEDIKRQLLDLQKQKTDLPKPPPGFRYKADGSGEQERIPGGPADVKYRQNMAGAKQSVDTSVQNIDALDAALSDLDQDPGLTRVTGPIAGRTGNLTTEATRAQGKLNTIKNQVFVATLQSMRQASKTGGAVGNVSDKEGDRLENSLASLDQAQGTEDFRRQIKVIRDRLRNSKETLLRAYSEQFPEGAPQGASGAPTQPGAPQPQQTAPSGWSITPVK